MPYTTDRVPALPKHVYGHASVLREIVGRAIDYVHLHNKGFEDGAPENMSRPLRKFFDDIVEKFPNWYGRESSAVLLPDQYDGAMRLRRKCALACRHARLYPKSHDTIKAFFTLVPDYIQKVVKDPDVPEPEYGLKFKVPTNMSTFSSHFSYIAASPPFYTGRPVVVLTRNGQEIDGVPLQVLLFEGGTDANRIDLSNTTHATGEDGSNNCVLSVASGENMKENGALLTAATVGGGLDLFTSVKIMQDSYVPDPDPPVEG